jgi:hypothetical protein
VLANSDGADQRVQAHSTTFEQGGRLKLVGTTRPYKMLNTTELATIVDPSDDEAIASHRFSASAM